MNYREAWANGEIEAGTLVDEIEEQAREIERLNSTINKAWNRSHALESGAYIPGALDAWKRPVLQNLPYDFSGNPGASATQYCNGWNDAGGYWKAHADDLSAELADLKSQPNGAVMPELPKPWQCETAMCPNLYTAEQVIEFARLNNK